MFVKIIFSFVLETVVQKYESSQSDCNFQTLSCTLGLRLGSTEDLRNPSKEPLRNNFFLLNDVEKLFTEGKKMRLVLLIY